MPDQLPEIASPEEQLYQRVKTAQVSTNTDQHLIEITWDKAEVCLSRHEEAFGRKQAWIAPAGMGVSIIATLVAATFQDALGLEAPVWKALFVLAGLACAVWFVVEVLRGVAIARSGQGTVTMILRDLAGLDQTADRPETRTLTLPQLSLGKRVRWLLTGRAD